ncbi:MAG: dihydrolipoyl dehydrogenase [Ardenticatenia bacterium]|nr:dihydrolipoyl dehydrogenase [Ardenticatenia bacterium]
MSEHYDLLIVGAGPGGYVAAIRAAQHGLNVACVDREALGGVCLNWGCIPSKALLKNAELVALLKHRAKEFGFSFERFEADYAVAVQRSRRVVRRLVGGIGYLFKKYGVTHIRGTARLTGPQRVEVDGQTYRATTIVLATGARPRTLPGIPVDGEWVMTYREAIVAEHVPNSVVIVGAGAIGMEFAYVYRAYGAEVTLVEFLPRLLPMEDEEISAEIEKAYRKLGVRFHTSSRVTAAERVGEKVHVRVEPAQGDGPAHTIEADRVLVAVGIQPNVEHVGLEEVGVALNERGFIQVDDYLRTTVPTIYAIGDVTGKLPLAHVASHQGIFVADLVAGKSVHPLDYDMMPRATYCSPQVASMGLTEQQARERGYDITVGKFPFSANGKALGMGEGEGFVKIVADAKYGEILGAHMIGPEVTELIAEFTLARTLESTPLELADAVHPHPTLSEVIAEAALATEGHPIHF